MRSHHHHPHANRLANMLTDKLGTLAISTLKYSFKNNNESPYLWGGV